MATRTEFPEALSGQLERYLSQAVTDGIRDMSDLREVCRQTTEIIAAAELDLSYEVGWLYTSASNKTIFLFLGKDLSDPDNPVVKDVQRLSIGGSTWTDDYDPQ